ncbi:hypothetical protein ACH5RR_014870 [Cinchona calisaya]|uniref:F-box domain-containing protein n=1 Tax=Cinchona calisaya TaxID=153742 RepID=A0ABD2ZRJ5_9GENT
MEANPQNLCSQFNELPDEIIHSILDKLPLEDAVQTSFLSQRWKNLWKYITQLDIGPSWLESTGKEVVPSMNHFIRLHMGEKIKNFSVRFTYEPHMSEQVDSWIQFATNKKVENLYIDFHVNRGERDPSYVLNSCIFNCESLIILHLRCCIITLPNSISLQNLKEIYFHHLELDNMTVYTLTSNTPVLLLLSLMECNRRTDLHIDIAPNSHFKSLMISDPFMIDTDTRIDIKVPRAKEFMFESGLLPRESYNIEISLECERVILFLDSLFVWCSEVQSTESDDEADEEEQEEEEVRFNFPVHNQKTLLFEQKLLDILGFCKGAESLKISNWCIQVLALRERRNTKRLQFNCKSLKLYTHFNKWELPGITYMLKACQRLEELIMVSPECDDEIEPPDIYVTQDDFKGDDYLKHMQSILQLPNLRTVIMKNKGRYHSSYYQVKGILSGPLLRFKLAKLMKHISSNLDHVVISSKGDPYVFDPSAYWPNCNRFSCSCSQNLVK